MLSRDFVVNNLCFLSGINISIHDYNLLANKTITGVPLNFGVLHGAICKLRDFGVKVRLNCNCIAGFVDSRAKVSDYILHLGKPLGANSVRFAELKGDTEKFVNLANVFGLPDGYNPFCDGCSIEMLVLGMPVNVRMMCGLQTKQRPPPDDPEQQLHGVLYYDGQIYEGWQRDDRDMDKENIQRLIAALAAGKISQEYAVDEIMQAVKGPATEAEDTVLSKPSLSNSGCQY
jgi:hypothetical protein